MLLAPSPTTCLCAVSCRAAFYLTGSIARSRWPPAVWCSWTLLLPYSGKFLQDSKMLVVKVPRRQLEARLGKIRNMVTRLILPARAQDRLTSMVMGMLPSLARQMNSISDQLVGNHVLDLIAVSLAKAVEGARPRVACSRALLLLNIRAVIEARLNDV
jgi:AraC family transcriptional activator of tynA and feaB